LNDAYNQYQDRDCDQRKFDGCRTAITAVAEAPTNSREHVDPHFLVVTEPDRSRSSVGHPQQVCEMHGSMATAKG
jgi:hypothetical protein